MGTDFFVIQLSRKSVFSQEEIITVFNDCYQILRQYKTVIIQTEDNKLKRYGDIPENLQKSLDKHFPIQSKPDQWAAFSFIAHGGKVYQIQVKNLGE